ncbi:MAG: efflux RND transporter periplasmic adaptor subunit [Parashewanella sp.]
MSKLTKLVPILPITLVAILTACSQGQTEEKEQDVYAIPVETARVTTGDVGSFYSTTATLEAPEEAEVVTRVSGLITQLHGEEGLKVKKGQLLATIDAKRQLFQFRQTQADVKLIEQELQRLNNMSNKQFVSADAMAKLEYRLQSAKAQRDLAKLQLTESEIRSPIDGVIAKRLVKAGNMIKEFQPLFHIVRQDELHAIVHLPQQQLSKLKLQQVANIHNNHKSEQTHTHQASVIRISPIVDPQSGTFKVTLLMPNKNSHFKAGMFTRAQIQYDQKIGVTTIPYAAVINQDNKNTVYIVQDNKALQRTVELGYRQNGMVEVIAGITAEDSIVIRGQHNLKDQSDVEVINNVTLAAAK